MRIRGLPASVRAVPARLFERPPRSFSLRPRGGSSFAELVRQLPPDLLELSLTHSSWVDLRKQSYERLEFLGDSVLGLAIASTLWNRYPDSGEGDLARLKAFVVSRASCAQVAERVGLAQLMMENAPAPEPKRREAVANQTILGNVLEALIGAVFLTHGFEQARLAVIDAFGEQIQIAITAHVDHKTALQELLAPKGIQPIYRLVGEVGPPHARVFTSEVLVSGVARGRGSGTTIKMSEQNAAGEALVSLGVTEEGAAG